MTRLAEMYGGLKLLLNILSVRIADGAAVRAGQARCGRSRYEYIESRKFEMSLSVW